MTSESLPAAIGAQRTRVAQLEANLAPRHAREAEELASLEKAQVDAQQRLVHFTRELERSRAEVESLGARRKTLEQGLSRARRSWLRFGEPALGGLLLFFSLVVVGASREQPLEVAGLELLGFGLGLALTSWRRAVRRLRS